MTEDETKIRSAVQAYGKAMQAMDLEALKGLWDRDDPHLLYQPEEQKRAFRGWNEIVAYWSYIPTVVDAIREWREIDLDIAVIGDVALVYALFMTSFALKGVAEPLAGEVRFTFGLRRHPDRWRFIHAHESRLLVVDGQAAH